MVLLLLLMTCNGLLLIAAICYLEITPQNAVIDLSIEYSTKSCNKFIHHARWIIVLVLGPKLCSHDQAIFPLPPL